MLLLLINYSHALLCLAYWLNMAFITCLGFTKLFLRLERHFKLCAATLDVSSPSCLVPLAIKNSDLILFQRLSLRIQSQYQPPEVPAFGSRLNTFTLLEYIKPI